jgi:PBP1b-binding outer membrane lipoprotein LpoB
MKKMLTAAVAAVTIVVLAGCASVQTAGPEDLNTQKLTTTQGVTDVSHVHGLNWGFYLLSIPIFSGSTEKPGSMLFNKDTVNVHSVVNMVTKKSQELGATHTVDLQSGASSMWIFPVFFIKEVQVSGNAVK